MKIIWKQKIIMKTQVEIKRLVSGFSKLSEISQDEKKLEEFYLKFAEDAIETCQEVGELLSEKLPDELHELEKKVKEVEAWSFYLIGLSAMSEFYVDIYSKFYLPPKDKTLTDIDRKVILDHKIASVKALNKLMENTLKAISQRVNLCQSLFKSQTAISNFGNLGG